MDRGPRLKDQATTQCHLRHTFLLSSIASRCRIKGQPRTPDNTLLSTVAHMCSSISIWWLSTIAEEANLWWGSSPFPKCTEEIRSPFFPLPNGLGDDSYKISIICNEWYSLTRNSRDRNDVFWWWANPKSCAPQKIWFKTQWSIHMTFQDLILSHCLLRIYGKPVRQSWPIFVYPINYTLPLDDTCYSRQY